MDESLQMLKVLQINRLQWFWHITGIYVNTIFRKELELQEKAKDQRMTQI